MPGQAELLPGTLDLLILKAASWHRLVAAMVAVLTATPQEL